MAWLLRDDEVLASLELAETPVARARGLLGRSTIDGALLIRPARSIHTIGMRFDIDVAFCDAELVVIKTMRLGPHRMTIPVKTARVVIEAEAGAFEHWDLNVGDQLDIKG